MVKRATCAAVAAAALLLFRCWPESDRQPYSRWQQITANESGIVLDVPASAAVHDFGSAVLVFVRPVFKPLLSDWQYAVEIKAEPLHSPAVGTPPEKARGAGTSSMSGQQRDLSVKHEGDVTVYRSEKRCNDSEVIRCTAYHYRTRGNLSAAAIGEDDAGIRRVLVSARCR